MYKISNEESNVHELKTKIIENGNAPIVTKTVDGKETVTPPTSVEEKAQRRVELKARRTLLMALPNEHQLNTELIEQTYERLQKLIRQLEMHGEVIPQEDINQKFLRSLSQEWTMHTIVWRNKPEIETLSLDDLFNNLKSYESEVKGTSSSTTNSHNVAFSLFMDLQIRICDDLDRDRFCGGTLHNALTMRARRFLKNTRRKAESLPTMERIGFDKSKWWNVLTAIEWTLCSLGVLRAPGIKDSRNRSYIRTVAIHDALMDGLYSGSYEAHNEGTFRLPAVTAICLYKFIALSFVPEYSEYISYTYNNTMSFANSDMKLATMPAPQPKPYLFLDELKVDETGSVIVMIGRVWDVTATTGRYLSKDFVVSDSKFDGATIVRKAFVSGDDFLRYAFRLVEFDDIELTNNKYFIDVAGYVTNVRRSSYMKGGSKTLEFYLANPKGQSLRVNLWGSVGDLLIEKKTAHPGVCPVVLTSMFAKLYNNRLYLSSSSSTLIYGDDDIPILSDEPNKEVMVVDSSRPREGTIENLLLWARNRKNDPVTFVCNVMIEDVRRKSGWNYPSCGGEKCRKRLSMDNGTFKCGTCGKIVDYPVLRYRLEVVVADDTAHTVVVLFNEMATELVKCSADSIIDALDEGIEDDSELPTPIRNIIGTSHTMEIKSHTYYEHPTYESFNCWRLNPTELANEGTTSNDQLIRADAPESSFKRLTKHPTMSTPSKPNETMSKKRSELDDSDTDDASTSVVGSHDMNAKDSQNKKKKKKYADLQLIMAMFPLASSHDEKYLFKDPLHPVRPGTINRITFAVEIKVRSIGKNVNTMYWKTTMSRINAIQGQSTITSQ
ncbi:replication protein A 70 kDa DNA-binding subunit C-like protein [Tanacetum coccineum]|uniref:Replication protein A 70 kDa DNA-binding subunit C-like protein n=1 Tax=Tanacetum coccineum TaxID=301880 RepID=A0ABQ5JFM7_9ASTR